MKTVFLLVRGRAQDGDFDIFGAYSSRTQADAVNKYFGFAMAVHPMPMNLGADYSSAGLKFYDVHLNLRTNDYGLREIAYADETREQMPSQVESPRGNIREANSVLMSAVWARDPEHAMQQFMSQCREWKRAQEPEPDEEASYGAEYGGPIEEID